MPSPDIGSVAPAASPTNMVRRDVRVTRSIRGGERPGPVRRLGLGVGTEDLGYPGSFEEVRPQPLHVADLDSSAPVDPESDVGPSVREREGPCVPGQEVGLEPDVQARPGAGPDVAEVLPERMGLAAIPGRAETEELAHR